MMTKFIEASTQIKILTNSCESATGRFQIELTTLKFIISQHTRLIFILDTIFGLAKVSLFTINSSFASFALFIHLQVQIL